MSFKRVVVCPTMSRMRLEDRSDLLRQILDSDKCVPNTIIFDIDGLHMKEALNFIRNDLFKEIPNLKEGRILIRTSSENTAKWIYMGVKKEYHPWLDKPFIDKNEYLILIDSRRMDR